MRNLLLTNPVGMQPGGSCSLHGSWIRCWSGRKTHCLEMVTASASFLYKMVHASLLFVKIWCLIRTSKTQSAAETFMEVYFVFKLTLHSEWSCWWQHSNDRLSRAVSGLIILFKLVFNLSKTSYQEYYYALIFSCY